MKWGQSSWPQAYTKELNSCSKRASLTIWLISGLLPRRIKKNLIIIIIISIFIQGNLVNTMSIVINKGPVLHTRSYSVSQYIIKTDMSSVTLSFLLTQLSEKLYQRHFGSVLVRFCEIKLFENWNFMVQGKQSLATNQAGEGRLTDLLVSSFQLHKL